MTTLQPIDPSEEAELLAALRAGDDDAFERVVRVYANRMLAVARRILRDEHDAADAVQDGFLSALRRLDDFEGRSRFSTWLHRIVVNAALMRRRSDRRRQTVSVEALLPRYKDDGHRFEPGPGWTQTPQELLEDAESRAILERSIDELPDDYRDIIILRDIEQLSTRDASEALGISEPLVKTRLHRARQALRTLLERKLT